MYRYRWYVLELCTLCRPADYHSSNTLIDDLRVRLTSCSHRRKTMPVSATTTTSMMCSVKVDSQNTTHVYSLQNHLAAAGQKEEGRRCSPNAGCRRIWFHTGDSQTKEWIRVVASAFLKTLPVAPAGILEDAARPTIPCCCSRSRLGDCSDFRQADEQRSMPLHGR